MQHRISRTLGVTSILCAAIGCGGHDPAPTSASAALTAECVPADANLPSGAWECSASQTIECTDGTGSADIGTVYVRETATDGCGQESSITVSESGPFAVGVHHIQVLGSSDALLCETQLTVVDSAAPSLEPHTINLWPPNHKFHSIAIEDCVTVKDACQSDLHAEFVWASSDEPVDALGDGHFGPDIIIDDCNHVQVRAERQGPKDGRVYKLGVRVVDGSGNATESECAVIVDHDQRGVVGADSGEAYRVELNGQGGAPSCDGHNEPPPVAPPGDAGGGGNGGNPGGGSDAGSDNDAGTPTEPPPPPVVGLQ